MRHNARGVGSLGVVEPPEEVDRSPGVVADPSIVDALDRQRREREVSLPTEPASRHELGALEDAKVLEHGGAVEVGEPGAELARGAGRCLEHVEDPATRVRGERLEDEIVGPLASDR